MNFLAVEHSELDRKWPPTIIHDGITCPHVTHGYISAVWYALIHSRPRCRQVGRDDGPSARAYRQIKASRTDFQRQIANLKHEVQIVQERMSTEVAQK